MQSIISQWYIFQSNYVLLERDFGSGVGEDKKLGLGNSVRSSPLLLGEGLINMLEGRIEGKTRTDSTDRWRKRPRIEGETQNEGAARDWARIEVCGGAGWALPKKILKMHPWNYTFWCIVESKIYIFPIGSRNFPKKGWNQISISYFNF